jgi:error-prone DNA polymerase
MTDAVDPSGYVELHCRSCFSLLDGAASPEGLIERAHALGQRALALTDHADLGGVVRFSGAGRIQGVETIIGAELTIMVNGERSTVNGTAPPTPFTVHRSPFMSLVLLAESATGYANISTLITRARMDCPRGSPAVPLDLLARHADGVTALTGGPRGWVPSLLAAGDTEGARRAATALRDIYGDHLVIECWDHGLPEEREIVAQLIPLAEWLGVPWIVANDVHYARPQDRRVHDVLAALRHKATLDQMGTRLRPNGEWYLKSAAQMTRRWHHALEGIRATVAIAERCAFRLEQLQPTLPAFPLPPGVGEDEYLERLATQGLDERLKAPHNSRLTTHDSTTHRTQLAHELNVIARLGLAGFFLIVWDIVRFARRSGILCQGRGSAANSVVCYCLGITAVDPVKMNLLFERFLSEGRAEPPDIDLDIAHRERERVLQYVYERYGREHAAMVCEQISWRGRSAVRDSARVLGFSVQQADALAAFSDRFSARATAQALRGREKADAYTQDNAECADDEGSGKAPGRQGSRKAGDDDLAFFSPASVRRRDAEKRALAHTLGQQMIPGTEAKSKADAVQREVYLDPHADQDHIERRNPVTSLLGSTEVTSVLIKAGLDPDDPRVALLADLVEGLHQLPRHRSIHVGGFVLTREPLSRIVPIEPASMPGRTVIQWEKDDLDPVGLVKIDLLGLGMLTLLQDCLLYVHRTRGVSLDLGTIPVDDPAVYDDLCRADTIGLFQVESRAQMNTLPRMKPRAFYDLVVEVALIRPGPIQGDMVHPFLRRRAGLEEVTYPHPSLEPVLKRTLGIPLFQEQGMQVAIAAAGFSPGQADELRRAMGHKRSHERMAEIAEQLVEGMAKNGIDADTARRIYQQINAFADYGFPESHAASFALLVYASAYLRHYYPPEYTAAILNAQPMGFYSPGTLVEDAKRHGVEVRPVDALQSGWDATLEVAGHGSRVMHNRTSSHDPRPTTHNSPAVRLGFRSIRGLGTAAREKIERAINERPFSSVADVVNRTGLDRGALRSLAESGALDGLVQHESPERRRRMALWEVLRAERGVAGPLAALPPCRPAAFLPPMTPYELTEADYRMTALSLNGHPMAHLRREMNRLGVTRATDLEGDGQAVLVAGLVICRQRPGTAKGFVFLTLEDETGLVNVIVTPKRFEQQALLIARSPLLLIRGTLQIEGHVVNVRGEEFRLLNAPVGAEHARRHDFH